MKSIIISFMFIVLLSACSSPTPVPATATATVLPIQTEPATPTSTELATPTPTVLPLPTQTEPPIATQTEPSFATVTTTPTPPPNSVKVCVLPYRLTVRTGPGTTYGAVGVLKKSTCVFAIARNPNTTWFWVVSNDANGWVSGMYLSAIGGLSTLPLLTDLTQTPGAVVQNPVPSATIQP